MPELKDLYRVPAELVLGRRIKEQVPEADQCRQREEAEEILRRLRGQPGVILADEVGMGKTFIALAVAYSIASRSPRGPVIVMVPPNLVDKWAQDLKTFCELYLENRKALDVAGAERGALRSQGAVRFGIARHSIDLLKLLDDPAGERSHLIFLAQGAMSRQQSDKWVRLALIAEALRRHAKGRATRLIQVKKNIHRFLAELVWAIGSQRASSLGDTLWKRLLSTDPSVWRRLYNDAMRGERMVMKDDPVPKAVLRTIRELDLKPLASALRGMPVRVWGGDERLSERLSVARRSIREVEEELWKSLLAQARWRSPLLVMDEAHHLKNPSTRLARELQSADSAKDLKTGDGAMANAFDRMLFLTATPFQLGHRELVRVLERFGDVRWNKNELGEKSDFEARLADLQERLDDSQRKAIALQSSWSKLLPEDVPDEEDSWWDALLRSDRESLSYRQKSVIDAFQSGRRCRERAEAALSSWVVRHSKGAYWAGSEVVRRRKWEGAAVLGEPQNGGLRVPPDQLLPFFLAARSAARPGQDLLGEALCSSYEAFRWTRKSQDSGRDELDDDAEKRARELVAASWYLKEFDQALDKRSGRAHPKISPVVKRVVGLWERGEKVLVFAFYRQTCNWLRTHISEELEGRLAHTGLERLESAGLAGDENELEVLLERIRDRYIDTPRSPGRRALDQALGQIVSANGMGPNGSALSGEDRELVLEIMRRFLRVDSTLTRWFPLGDLETTEPREVVRRFLDNRDESQVSWREKFGSFVTFLVAGCSTDERRHYLEAAARTETGLIRVGGGKSAAVVGQGAKQTLANVQVATGDTPRDQRARLMRAFNTPFFPDILVCSQVMGEGVDLQRFCRHVVHHDLAWNPSTIEQRTGRIDRLGCKAEGRQSIEVYLPYLAGTADDRQFHVMSERERWFRVVMGENEVAKLITPDSASAVQLPEAVANELSFNLSVVRNA